MADPAADVAMAVASPPPPPPSPPQQQQPAVSPAAVEPAAPAGSPAPAEPAPAVVGTLRTKRARVSVDGEGGSGGGGCTQPGGGADAAPPAPPPPAMADDPRWADETFLPRLESDGPLAFLVLSNAPPPGSHEAVLKDQHAIWLVDLKNIYAKQLPNMPKEYIVRLVFDRSHASLLALRGGVVVGGVTYRTFPAQRMAEVAFCAVSGTEQVKGYGTRIMERLKGHAQAELRVTHLITFADNNAVGYFAKQGFTREILMEREKWAGYIKEYDGGTLMECILGAPAPADFGRLIRLQKEAVLAKVRSMTCSHMTHPGLAAFKPGGSHAALRPGGIRTPLPPASIPGLRDAGWAPQPPRYRLVLPGLADGGAPTAGNVRAWQRALLQAVVDHPDSWPFRAPVDPAVVLDYYEVVREPMDLATIGQRVDAGDYYATLELFAADFRRIFTNARLYNAPDTPYFKLANKCEAFWESKVAATLSWSKRGPPVAL